jgi:ABC-type Zn2+ transport system substrate-binding protein/surface adhesin
MKLNLVTKLIPALFIAAGLCIGCGGNHDHDHDHDHDHGSGDDHGSGHDHGKPEKTSSADDGYPLKICLVSDEGLTSMGEPFVHVWNGTTVKLCCKGCLEDFEKEPKKFLAKLDAAKKGGSPKSEKETEKPVKPAQKE